MIEFSSLTNLTYDLLSRLIAYKEEEKQVIQDFEITHRVFLDVDIDGQRLGKKNWYSWHKERNTSYLFFAKCFLHSLLIPLYMLQAGSLLDYTALLFPKL